MSFDMRRRKTYLKIQRVDKIDTIQEQDEGDTKRMIALVAHNNMKQAMLEFVGKYQTFFGQIPIVSTKSTGFSLENGLGIKIQKKVCSGPLGGDQEIGAMVANDLIAGVIFFVDPLTPHPHQDDVRALMRNPMSGKALVHAFLTSQEHISLLQKTVKNLQNKNHFQSTFEASTSSIY